MGACLATIKVIGTTTLGIYAGTVLTATFSGYDVLLQVLTAGSHTPSDTARAHAVVKRHLGVYGAVLGALGTVSSIAFQLAYTQAPKSLKHPYLVYASLVFPVSASLWYLVSGSALSQYFKFPYLLGKSPEAESKVSKKAKKEELLKSDLDNSVYKDLGDSSSTDEAAHVEDEEIEEEVESHLNQQAAIGALNKLQLSNKIISGLSLVGFTIATIGVYGDH